MPAHYKLEAFLDEYIRAAGLGDQPKSPLFLAARGRSGELNGDVMHRVDAWRMDPTPRRRTPHEGQDRLP